MRFEVVTLFPELVEPVARVGLLGKAAQAGRISLHTASPRDFATDKHRSVDDTPYGGGSGMVMLPEPLVGAMEALDERARDRAEPRAHRVLLTPGGRPFHQTDAARLAQLPALMLICGRYEGMDERVCEHVAESISLGDFVLNGGEVAAMAIIEAVARLLPDVIGNAESLREESHASTLLEYPQYTRPREYRGSAVPEVLLSGDHGRVAAFRREQSLRRTLERRPELLARAALDEDDKLEVNRLRGAAAASVYCALLHHPVRDRDGETVSSAVTTLDVHDIARSARTYGLKGYFVVTPIEAQRRLVEALLEHWDRGPGRKRMPARAQALALCRVRSELQQVTEEITQAHGRPPTIVATSARPGQRSIDSAELRTRLGAEPGPFLILFGTGHGLTDGVLESADRVLAPIEGVAGYNHLSVRAAAAITLDRLLGALG